MGRRWEKRENQKKNLWGEIRYQKKLGKREEKKKNLSANLNKLQLKLKIIIFFFFGEISSDRNVKT